MTHPLYPEKKVSPQMGGCWFCHKVDGGLVWEKKFDTQVHVDCIRAALIDDPDDPEANIMEYLIKMGANW